MNVEQDRTSGGEPAWTIQRILDWSANFLRDKGSESARLDAELLLAHALKCQRIQLYTGFDRALTTAEREPFKQLLVRRGAGEPVAYLTGVKEFLGFAFKVSKAVLIPRPDTEVLVEVVVADWKMRKAVEAAAAAEAPAPAPEPEAPVAQVSDATGEVRYEAYVDPHAAALDAYAADADDPDAPEKSLPRLPSSPAPRTSRAPAPSSMREPSNYGESGKRGAGEKAASGPRILDIGTGSGCIALSLAKLIPTSSVTAWDISPEALALAEENRQRLKLDNVRLGRVDALDPSSWNAQAHGGPFDLIVSNPPYIARDEENDLAVDVKAYEPHTALFAERGGLAFYEIFAARAASLLTPGGALHVEIGHEQAEAVTRLLEAAGWRQVKVTRDYGKLDRVVSALRS